MSSVFFDLMPFLFKEPDSLLQEGKRVLQSAGFEIEDETSSALLATKGEVTVVVSLRINTLSVNILAPSGNRNLFVANKDHLRKLFNALSEGKNDNL